MVPRQRVFDYPSIIYYIICGIIYYMPTVAIYLDDELLERLKQIAENEKMTLSAVVRTLLRQSLGEGREEIRQDVNLGKIRELEQRVEALEQRLNELMDYDSMRESFSWLTDDES